jgi:hypothetical protein
VGVFEERLTNTLGDAAMVLSVENHWIDGAPDIVDRNEMDDLDGAGFDVNLDLTDLRAEWKTCDPYSLVGDADERPSQFLRQARALDGRGGNIEEADLTIGAACTPASWSARRRLRRRSPARAPARTRAGPRHSWCKAALRRSADLR